MIDELVKKYKLVKKDDLLSQIVEQSEKLTRKALHAQSLPWQVEEDIIENCRSLVLLKAIEDFDVTIGAKFQTFLYWRIRAEINRKLRYYTRQKRINYNQLTPLKEEMTSGKSNFDRFVFQQDLDFISEQLSEIAKQVFYLLRRGHSKNFAFKKLDVPFGLRTRISEELKDKLRKYVY